MRQTGRKQSQRRKPVRAPQRVLGLFEIFVKARVLDRDRGLIGQSGEKLKIFVRINCLVLFVAEIENADQLSLSI